MGITLLATKLYMPSLTTDLVSRPRLVEQLKLSLQVKLTLVSAPAGFGKTTAVNECLRSSQIPAAWISLDEGDNDPIHFWAYFISALQTVHTGKGQQYLELLLSPQPPAVEYFITNIINEMSEIKGEFTIVLDDYHAIKAKPVHDKLAFLINHLPPQVHLILISRIDPLLPLAYLRAQNQLLEVRASDLSLTSKEATTFLNEIMALDLSDEDIAILTARTEGWIVGLHLAALSIRGRDDVHTFIASFGGTNRYVLDYLIEETLDKQEAATQSFLLETSILNQLSNSLCNAVTDRNDGQEMLEFLEARNLFTLRLDNEGKWYRYHQLYAELLQYQLNRLRPSFIPILHHRASIWYEQEGFRDEAVQHALSANNFERAADLIMPLFSDFLIFNSLLPQGRISTLLGFLESLPDDVINGRPLLCVSYAWACLISDQYDKVEALLKSAESKLVNKALSDAAIIRGHISGIRSYTARLNEDVPGAIKFAEDALNILPVNESVVRSAIALNLGLIYYITGEISNSIRYFEEAKDNGKASGNLFAFFAAVYYLVKIMIAQGRLDEAKKISQGAIQSCPLGLGDQPLPVIGYTYVSLGMILYEWNDLQEANHFLTQGTEFCEMMQAWSVAVDGWITLARLKQALGQMDEATNAIERAEIAASKITTNIEAKYISGWKARLSLRNGNLPPAIHWADLPETRISLQIFPDYQLESSYLTLVRLQIVRGDTEQVTAPLERFLNKVEEEERTGTVIEILVLQAMALQKQGEKEKALIKMERAISLAESEHYIRTFVDEGEPVARLLGFAASRGTERDYINELLAVFRSSPSHTGFLSTTAVLTEPLSNRENEVLKLINSGLLNREIAKVLAIEESTVKTHINNIYSKLHIHTRVQAILRARQLDLI